MREDFFQAGEHRGPTPRGQQLVVVLAKQPSEQHEHDGEADMRELKAANGAHHNESAVEAALPLRQIGILEIAGDEEISRGSPHKCTTCVIDKQVDETIYAAADDVLFPAGVSIVGTAPLRSRQWRAVVPTDAAQGHYGACRPFQLCPGPARRHRFGPSVTNAPDCLLRGRENKHFQRAKGEHNWYVSMAGPCTRSLDPSFGGDSLKRTGLSATLDDHNSLELPQRSCGVLSKGT